MALRSLFASKNLDVPETSRDSISQALKDRRVIWRLSRSYPVSLRWRKLR